MDDTSAVLANAEDRVIDEAVDALGSEPRTMAVNLLVDMLYGVLNPRIRHR